MDERERNILRDNTDVIAVKVAESGRTKDVIYELKEQGVITPAVACNLQTLEGTNTWKMKQLINQLQVCGERAFDKFTEVLIQQGLGSLVRTLHPEMYQRHRGSISGESDELEDLQRLPNMYTTAVDHSNLDGGDFDSLPSLPCPPRERPSRRPNSLACGGAASNSAETELEQAPLRIRVRQYMEIGGQHRKPSHVYRNRSMPRGLVFLANYKNFVDNEHPVREGSETDVKNLSLLFTEMGYKIPRQHVNMNKYETIKALRDFLALEDHKVVDSCIVIIMSHGRDGKSFYTSDNNFMSVNDVVERFSNKECPALSGKPKIFIFQYCRGRTPDRGVDPSPRLLNTSQSLKVQTDSAQFGEAIIQKDPTYTDMYIIYSTVEGFASFRHPQRGSWLVEAICHVFMENAHESELEELMKTVSRRVRETFADDGSKQVCEFVQRGFDRHFYFNPEKLGSIGLLNLSTLSHALSESTGSLNGRVPSPVPLSPLFRRRHLRPRSRSRGNRSSSPMSENLYHTRHRNLSGASKGSEGSVHDLDPQDLSPESPAVYPRVQKLKQRRISMPEPIHSLHPYSPHLPHESFDRAFSEQGETTEEMTEDPFGSPHHMGSAGNSVNELTSSSEMSFDMVDNIQDPPGAVGGTPSKSPISGIEEESLKNNNYLAWREQLTIVERESAEHIETRYVMKRQLSTPSAKETLEKIKDVKTYLELNNPDPQVRNHIERVESFITKQKSISKRRKVTEPESKSLEY